MFNIGDKSMKVIQVLSLRRGTLTACALLLAFGASAARAQPATYPDKPVRIVSISSAGTGVDDFTRLLAQYLSQKTGQTFYVEPKPGANTAIAADHVAKSAPDGYTLLLAAASTLVANPYMIKNLPYDPNKDLAPIARLSVIPIALTVPANSPYQTLGDLMTAGRAAPGKLNYGSATTGYTAMTEAVNGSFGVRAVNVPYKGSGLMLPDLMSGRLDYAMVEISQATPQVQAGRLRALAVSSPSRVGVLPEVPTLAEAGASEAALMSWLGLMAPTGTPQPIIDKLSKLSVEFVNSPEANAHFKQRGSGPYAADAAAFRTAILEEQAKWKRYIEAAGIKAE